MIAIRQPEEDNMIVSVQLRARFANARQAEEMLDDLPASWEVLDDSHPSQLNVCFEGGEVIQTTGSIERTISVHLEERVACARRKRTIAYNVYVENEAGLEFWKAYHWNPTAVPGAVRSLRSIPLGRTIIVIAADKRGRGEAHKIRGGGRDDVVHATPRRIGGFRGVRLNWQGRIIDGEIDPEIDGLERHIAETIQGVKNL